MTSTPRSHRNATSVAWLLLCAMLAPACTGPREPLAVGVREVASDIVLGRQGAGPVSRPVASPIPPAPVAVNLPTPLRLTAPPPLVAPSPTPTARRRPSCPTADPLHVPAHGASDQQGTPPVAEASTFRNEGEFAVTGANAHEGVFEEQSVRAVANVVLDEGGDFTYDVIATLGGTQTRSSYLMRNRRPVDDGLGIGDQANVDQQRGLYLTGVDSRLPDDRLTSFRPATPLRLLRFPAFIGDTFDEVATDPLSGTTMQYTVTVVGSVRVDACGALVDAIRVELTDGRVDGPESNVEFTATYDVATQYGGLIVRDRIVASGREGLDTVTRSVTSTINRVPSFFEPTDASTRRGDA